MNSRSTTGGPASGDGQSPLSLLVNAADSRDLSQHQRESAFSSQSLAETFRLRGLTSSDQQGQHSLEEQLLMQQQQLYGAAPSPAALLSLRDHNLLSQLGGSQNHHHQLAALLSLGGGGAADLRSALAAAQLRQHQSQQQQFSHADILALSRSGALSGHSGFLGSLSAGGGLGGAGPFGGPGGGLAGLTAGSGLVGLGGAGASLGAGSLGGGGLGGGPGPAPNSVSGLGGVGASGGVGATQNGLVSELESLQRLEEIERRQRLMASGASPLVQGSAAAPSTTARGDPAGGVRGPILRDERIQAGHAPRPITDSSQSSKKNNHTEDVRGVSNVSGMQGLAVAENGSKEDLEKTPGSVIVPCRARGMPMDHNFKTAYFVIPENVKHGEELICSYFACRNAGIKFRYCSHCKVPVAKRNFRKRHKHGGEEVPPIHGDADDSDGEEVGGKRGIPAQITAKSSSMDADALSSNSSQTHDKDEAQENLVRASIGKVDDKRDPRSNVASWQQDVNPKITPERMERWASLLGRRPATKEGDMMSAWLMDVLAVSDLDTPLKSSSDPNTNSKTDSSSVKGSGVLGSTRDAKTAAKDTSSNSAAKKKRSPDMGPSELAGSASNTSETFASGSFAAWKERKKQKKQAKINSSQEPEA